MMITFPGRVVAVVSIGMGLLASPLFGLTWERTSLLLKTEAGAGALVAEFPFKNESEQPVVIGELRSSCGCSTPTVAEKVIAPGGKGVVAVTYEPGDRVGMQVSNLTIPTDEPGARPTVLALRVDIRPAIECRPKLVRWTTGQPAEEQTVTIKREVDAAVIAGVASPDGSLEARLSAFDAGSKSWTLHLRPKSTDAKMTGKVEVRVAVNGHETTYTVFGLVR